jgi:hypothetical protein
LIGGGLIGGGAANEEQAAMEQAKAEARAEQQRIEDMRRAELAERMAYIDKFEALTPLQAQQIAQNFGLADYRGQYIREQERALAALEGLSRQGIRPEEWARYQQAQNAARQQEAAMRGALMQQQAQRGIGGSGIGMAQNLQAQQAAISNLANAGLGLTQQAGERQRQATGQWGGMASQMREQSAVEQARYQAAQQAINQFNAQQRASVDQFNRQQKAQVAGMRTGAYTPFTGSVAPDYSALQRLQQQGQATRESLASLAQSAGPISKAIAEGFKAEREQQEKAKAAAASAATPQIGK